MALIKCSDCGKEISDLAKTCIGCGRPINIKPDFKPEEILPDNLQCKRSSEVEESLPPSLKQFFATKKKVAKDKVGLGCFLQGTGLLAGLLALWPVFGSLLGAITVWPVIVGLFLGVGLLYLGGNISQAKLLICSNCGNQVIESASICPVCNNRFTNDLSIEYERRTGLYALGAFLLVFAYFALFYTP
jgi:DNA-directed RNA polymerase subunit RPC12/RpoP